MAGDPPPWFPAGQPLSGCGSPGGCRRPKAAGLQLVIPLTQHVSEGDRQSPGLRLFGDALCLEDAAQASLHGTTSTLQFLLPPAYLFCTDSLAAQACALGLSPGWGWGWRDSSEPCKLEHVFTSAFGQGVSCKERPKSCPWHDVSLWHTRCVHLPLAHTLERPVMFAPTLERLVMRLILPSLCRWSSRATVFMSTSILRTTMR